jgi:hypothetical protein
MWVQKTVLTQLHHPNIISLLGTFSEGKHLNIIFQVRSSNIYTIYLNISISLYLSPCIFASRWFYLSRCAFLNRVCVCVYVHAYVCVYMCVCVCVCVCARARLSVCLSVCLSVRPPLLFSRAISTPKVETCFSICDVTERCRRPHRERCFARW